MERLPLVHQQINLLDAPIAPTEINFAVQDLKPSDRSMDRTLDLRNDREGQSFGPYTLERLLGEGGSPARVLHSRDGSSGSANFCCSLRERSNSSAFIPASISGSTDFAGCTSAGLGSDTSGVVLLESSAVGVGFELQPIANTRSRTASVIEVLIKA
jgi:hypothetical protein